MPVTDLVTWVDCSRGCECKRFIIRSLSQKKGKNVTMEFGDYGFGFSKIKSRMFDHHQKLLPC